MSEEEKKEYCERLQDVIKNDFQIIMKILKNVDLEKKEISAETVPSLLLIKNIFLSSIIKNIEAIYSHKALQKVIDQEELDFAEKELDCLKDAGISSLENLSVNNLYM